jgi:8-oxo-dGTP diphosphatase
MEQELRTRVGIGIMIFKEGKVLLGKRKTSHGAGEYAFPGGHLEYMESFEACALREIAEECGIEVTNLRFQYLANVKHYAPKHYVHIGLLADWKSGEPKVLEPEKCESWDWYDIDNLPSPLFLATEITIDSYKNGIPYRDAIL